MSSHYIFVHGGPGYNSFPERELFSQQFTTFTAWHQPSQLRGEKCAPTFSHCADNLAQCINNAASKTSEPICVIAHSFGYQFLLAALNKLHTPLKQLILLAPAVNVHGGEINIMRLGLKTYQMRPNMLLAEQEKLNTQVLTSYLESPSKEFGEKRVNAIIAAVSHPEMLFHYFYQKPAIATYFQFIKNEYAFSMDDFISVRSTYVEPHISLEQFHRIKTLVIYGSEDGICPRSEGESHLRQLIPQIVIETWSENAHYPHIESKTKFIATCQQFTKEG
jgi:pimeloyl-ACP methyl ester carboxylesterase